MDEGSFIESFSLFGYNLNDYEDLFNEKLQLLLKINEYEVVSWDGKLRPSFDPTGIYPRVEHGKLPISIATGGTSESSLRAGAFGLPITYAIIGGNLDDLRNIEIYKSVAESYGHNPDELSVSVHSWGTSLKQTMTLRKNSSLL